MKTNIVDVFCIIDDFSKLFDEAIKKKTLEEADKKRRNRKFKMSDSEVMTILILFHLSRYRDLKAFYETFARRLVCILLVNSLYNRELFCIFEH